MLVLDFAAADQKTVCKIISCFTKREQFVFRGVLQSFWRSREELRAAAAWVMGGRVLEDGSAELPVSDQLTVRLWVQGPHYMASLEIRRKDPSWEMLRGMMAVMEKLRRRDYPVRVNRGETISAKAAVAIAALAVAQGTDADCAGILWDMARDREI